MVFAAEAERDLGIPLAASDSALYWSIARNLGIRLKPGVLGRLTEA